MNKISHYTVLVIGKNPEQQLEPFWELDLSRDEMMEDQRAGFVKSFAEEDLEKEFEKFKEKNKEDIEKGTKDYWIKYRTCTAKEWLKDWNGEYLNKGGTHYGYYTNPKARWDWHSLGGRWAGALKLKENSKGKLEEPRINGICDDIDKEKKETYEKNKNKSKADQALKKNIDFSMDKEEYDNAARFWELYIEGKKPKNKKERTMLDYPFYKKEYYLERFGTKEGYAKSQATFGTFAVLKDGEWFEKGKMGWFACHGATPEEEAEWDEDFYNKWIKELSDDTLLSVYDCHI